MRMSPNLHPFSLPRSLSFPSLRSTLTVSPAHLLGAVRPAEHARGGSYSLIGGAEPLSAGKRRKEKMEVRRDKIKSIYKSGPSQYPFNSLVM